MGQTVQSGFHLKQLARRFDGIIKNLSSKQGEAAGVSIDTRTLQPGNVYIALRGKKLDGHDFLRQAREGGASAFVVDQKFYSQTGNPRSPFSLSGYENVIVVRDTTQALQRLAASIRKEFKGICIGVTGSSGKTTTKEIIRALVGSRWELLASEGNQNNYIGLPLTLLKLDGSYQALLSELGASYPGEIGELSEILLPNCGMITNVYPCHLEGFGNIENIYKTKIELARHVLARGGTMVIGGDDNHLVSLIAAGKGRVVTFGINSGNTYQLTDSRTVSSGIEIVINGKHTFFIATNGIFNALNTVAAVALARELGMGFEAMARILRDFKFPKSRFEMIHTSEGIRMIDDAYNSNPTSLRLAIESFERMKTDGRKVLVCADMLELGERKEEFHYSLGENTARASIDAIVAVGPLMKEFLRGLHSIRERTSIAYGFENNEEARNFLKEFLKSGDLVLFKGSRSMKLEEIIECFMPSYIH
ncbi:MAG: UDP-N-acetylmuramoyl-tripeptide--D-alanyl-D-alanine ligase [Candidatus Omnitrophica bacterium]|nr:UDP-N-acetylmuramoyl-tripeptide--D-alanyl-D-alanine ligase [Candidatus Omnitrophota bacterium]